MAFFFLKSIVLCSIYHFCAAFTENIAVRLRLLYIYPVLGFLSNCTFCSDGAKKQPNAVDQSAEIIPIK